MPDEKNRRKNLFALAYEKHKKAQSRKLHELSEKRRAESMAESKRTEIYDKRIKKENLIVLKIKHGLINKEDTEFRTAHEEQKEYTTRQKIQANLAYYKPVICLGTAFSLIGAYLAYDLVNKPKPDFTAMMLTYDKEMSYFTSRIENLICEYITDRNENGETKTTVYYMDFTNEADTTLRYTLMHGGDAVMVLASDGADDGIFPEDSLDSLEKYYPDNEHVKGYGFYLSDTDFAKDIGYTSELPSGLYIGLRKVQDNVSYSSTMQDNYDVAKGVLDALVSRYT